MGMSYLGVVFDRKMSQSWNLNTATVVSKCKRIIGVFNRTVRKYLNINQRKWFLAAKVVPICLYGMSVAYPRGNSDRLRLERLNNTVCQAILRNYVRPYADILEALQMQPVYRAVVHKRVLLAHRYHSELRYQPDGTFAPAERPAGLRPLTHPKAFRLSVPTSMYIENSSLESLCDLWNQLPNLAASGKYVLLKQFLIDSSFEGRAADISHRLLTL